MPADSNNRTLVLSVVAVDLVGYSRKSVAEQMSLKETFNRVLLESSSYYLLGVVPHDLSRDGRLHELKVKLNRRGVTVRSRQWVVVPQKER